MSAPLHVHLDAVGGAAGDMFVAAMLDARPDFEPRVLEDVAAVLPPGTGRAVLTKGLSGGIAVKRFALVAEARSHPAHTRDHGHDHAHGHGRDQDHGHAEDRQHGHDPRDHGAHYPDLVRRIESAKLHEGTAREALAILAQLARTEARLHGVAIEDVHFHEVGDWDSLMDVVAAGSLAAALAPCTWSVSTLPRGDGFVRTHHGVLPVPAPATVAMLEGFRWRDDGVGGERVTPTGAGILAHLTQGAAFPAGELVLRASGNGAGTREMPGLPNILRATIFERAEGAATEAVFVVSFEVDDMTGEEIGVAADRLRATAGVVDVNLGQRWGKKGRPVTDFRLLVMPAHLDAVRDACFRETATIGLRESLERRTVLARESVQAGEGVRLKRVVRPGGEVTAKVESDDLAGHEGLAARRRLKARGESEGGA